MSRVQGAEWQNGDCSSADWAAISFGSHDPNEFLRPIRAKCWERHPFHSRLHVGKILRPIRERIYLVTAATATSRKDIDRGCQTGWPSLHPSAGSSPVLIGRLPFSENHNEGPSVPKTPTANLPFRLTFQTRGSYCGHGAGQRIFLCGQTPLAVSSQQIHSATVGAPKHP